MGRGFGISANVSAGVVAGLAREAERLGYRSFWTNDMPTADGLATLATAAAATIRIDLGVGVIPLDHRSAATIAAQVDALELPLDRLLVGVGAGGSRDALAGVRAGVDELRSETGARVVVGALGPRMAALAGEVADGVLLNWMSPGYAARAGRPVLDAATAAGRPRPALMAYVRCGLTPDARVRVDEELARYASIPSFERHLRRMGVSARETYVLGPDREALQQGVADHEAVLDETVVRAITPTDDAEDLLTLMRACAPPGGGQASTALGA